MPTAATKARQAAKPPDDTALDRAWNAVPKLARLAAAASTCSARLAEVAAAEKRLTAFSPDALADELTDGKPLPDSLGADLVEQAAVGARLAQEREALRLTLGQLSYKAGRARQAGADAALSVLHAELCALVEQGQPLAAELADVPDAAAAIRRGLVEQWRRFDELRTAYLDIRTAQRAITVEVLDPGVARPLIDRAGLVKDAERFEPLASQIAVGRTVRTGLLPLVEDAGHFTWVVGPDRRAWVPTVSELQAAGAAQDKAHAQARHARAVAAGLAGPRAELQERQQNNTTRDRLAALRAQRDRNTA